jgi:hypothetical protein
MEDINMTRLIHVKLSKGTDKKNLIEIVYSNDSAIKTYIGSFGPNTSSVYDEVTNSLINKPEFTKYIQLGFESEKPSGILSVSTANSVVETIKPLKKDAVDKITKALKKDEVICGIYTELSSSKPQAEFSPYLRSIEIFAMQINVGVLMKGHDQTGTPITAEDQFSLSNNLSKVLMTNSIVTKDGDNTISRIYIGFRGGSVSNIGFGYVTATGGVDVVGVDGVLVSEDELDNAAIMENPIIKTLLSGDKDSVVYDILNAISEDPIASWIIA